MSKIKKHVFLILFLISWIILYVNLQTIADFAVSKVFQLTEGEHLTESIRFFIFEVPKVMLLLILIIFVVGIIRSWFSPAWRSGKFREVYFIVSPSWLRCKRHIARQGFALLARRFSAGQASI